MLTDERKQTIVDLACKFGAREVIVFGQVLYMPEDASLLQLGVKGVPTKKFGKLEKKLAKALPWDVEVNDFSVESAWNRMAAQKGRQLYP